MTIVRELLASLTADGSRPAEPAPAAGSPRWPCSGRRAVLLILSRRPTRAQRDVRNTRISAFEHADERGGERETGGRALERTLPCERERVVRSRRERLERGRQRVRMERERL